MNSKRFVEIVYKTYLSDKMNLFDTILAVQEKHEIEQEEIVKYLKLEKTLLCDLQSECEAKGLLKSSNKSTDIEGLF